MERAELSSMRIAGTKNLTGARTGPPSMSRTCFQSEHAADERFHIADPIVRGIHVAGCHAAGESRRRGGAHHIIRPVVVIDDGGARSAQQDKTTAIGIAGDLTLVNRGHSHYLFIGRRIKRRGDGRVPGSPEKDNVLSARVLDDAVQEWAVAIAAQA